MSGQLLEFEIYNGLIDVVLLVDVKVNLRYCMEIGCVLIDFEIVIVDDVVRMDDGGQIEIDEFVYGIFNGGGLLIMLEMEKGNICL